MGSATLYFSRWTQRCGRQFHRCEYCGKHQARFLTEKALRSCRPVRPGKEKVVNGGEALSRAWQIESSQLMATQGQVAVAPLHVGTRALEHGGQSFGLLMEVVLNSRAQRTQNAAGCKQWGAEPLSECAQGVAIPDASSPGHTIEIVRGDQLGVHGKGDWRRDIELSNLLSDITRDERDGALHFWHHPLGFVDPL